MGQIKKPYAKLGIKLKAVRLKTKRTLDEVSGAVEIDVEQLKSIESGLKRPEEEVMLLLISYYNLADKEASSLWAMAHYESALSEHMVFDNLPTPNIENIVSQMTSKPMVMLMAIEQRIIYSDGFEISWNEAGLNINFTQNNTGVRPQNLSIAKIGMSYSQVNKLVQALEMALLHVKYRGSTKLLPPDNKV